MARFTGGQSREVERIEDAAAADQRVLAHLARLGCDETTRCLSSHFVYLPNRAHADATARALGCEGWQTAVVEGDGGVCLVVATQLSALDATRVGDTRRRLEELAAEHGGVYDGWQATAS